MRTERINYLKTFFSRRPEAENIDGNPVPCAQTSLLKIDSNAYFVIYYDAASKRFSKHSVCYRKTCSQGQRKFGLRVLERLGAGLEANVGHQLLHTAGRLRARPADRQGVDDRGRAPQAARGRVHVVQGPPGGGPAGRAGPVRARRYGHQAVVGRPEKETVHRLGAHHQPVDTVPGRAHHVSVSRLPRQHILYFFSGKTFFL